jgi:hypothetical protein
MTSLEQTLAAIYASIANARASGNSQILAGLLARKEAICAALAAPEHCWHEPSDNAPAMLPQRRAA